MSTTTSGMFPKKFFWKQSTKPKIKSDLATYHLPGGQSITLKYVTFFCQSDSTDWPYPENFKQYFGKRSIKKWSDVTPPFIYYKRAIDEILGPIRIPRECALCLLNDRLCYIWRRELSANSFTNMEGLRRVKTEIDCDKDGKRWWLGWCAAADHDVDTLLMNHKMINYTFLMYHNIW